MAWKKSKDGGLDYDTTLDTKYQKAKQQLFDPMGTAYTMTSNGNVGIGTLPPVKNRNTQIRGKINVLRRASNKINKY